MAMVSAQAVYDFVYGQNRGSVSAEDLSEFLQKNAAIQCATVAGWMYEDELPKSYPYDVMYPFSKVDGVRLFPVFAPHHLPTQAEARRERGMSITYGDHLIDSGYYELTEEQERELTSSEIVGQIYGLFGPPSLEEMAGRGICSLVAETIRDAARYRYLRDHCSSHYPMTHEQPAEWSIGWEFQQATPIEAYGSFDKWIDADIEAMRQRQAELDAGGAA